MTAEDWGKFVAAYVLGATLVLAAGAVLVLLVRRLRRWLQR